MNKNLLSSIGKNLAVLIAITVIALIVALWLPYPEYKTMDVFVWIPVVFGVYFVFNFFYLRGKR